MPHTAEDVAVGKRLPKRWMKCHVADESVWFPFVAGSYGHTYIDATSMTLHPSSKMGGDPIEVSLGDVVTIDPRDTVVIITGIYKYPYSELKRLIVVALGEGEADSKTHDICANQISGRVKSVHEDAALKKRFFRWLKKNGQILEKDVIEEWDRMDAGQKDGFRRRMVEKEVAKSFPSKTPEQQKKLVDAAMDEYHSHSLEKPIPEPRTPLLAIEAPPPAKQRAVQSPQKTTSVARQSRPQMPLSPKSSVVATRTHDSGLTAAALPASSPPPPPPPAAVAPVIDLSVLEQARLEIERLCETVSAKDRHIAERKEAEAKANAAVCELELENSRLRGEHSKLHGTVESADAIVKRHTEELKLVMESFGRLKAALSDRFKAAR